MCLQHQHVWSRISIIGKCCSRGVGKAPKMLTFAITWDRKWSCSLVSSEELTDWQSYEKGSNFIQWCNLDKIYKCSGVRKNMYTCFKFYSIGHFEYILVQYSYFGDIQIDVRMMECIIIENNFRNHLIRFFDGETETQKGKWIFYVHMTFNG